MRTLKKTLCLVLAVVMMLGLCAFHAGATDFKDDADISAEYKEAAEVLTAVGVFKGDNGEFKPTKALTRAEGATLIARLLGYDETKLTGKSSFTDVPDWAQAAVGVCETEGIVNGYGDGRFGPSDPLTGTAFAKMLLCVLGYDVNIESLVGADWEINTSKLAKSSGVGEDMLDVITNANINRQSAGQLCLNALKSDMVEYDSKGTTVTTSDGTVVTTGASKATVRKNAAGVSYNADAAGNASSETGATLQLCEDLYGNDLKITAGTTDDMGRPANKWRYKNKDVGTFAASAQLLYSTTKTVKVNALYDIIGKDAYNNLVDGTDELYVYIDGVVAGVAKVTSAAANIQRYFNKDSSGNAAGCGNGTLFELYRVEDGVANNRDKYVIVIAHTYLVKATANYNSSSESVKVGFLDGATNTLPTRFPKLEIDNDDFPVSDVVKDDYLLVTYSQDSREFQTVAKAELLTGSISSYVVDNSVTIDGTKHSYSATIQTGTTHGKSVPFEVGAQVKVVLDQNDNVIYVDEADASSSYVYIKSSGTNTLKTKVEAQAYFTDGTDKVITVKKATYYDGNGTTRTTLQGDGVTSAVTMTGNGGKDYLKGQWYTYTVDDSGEYTIKAVGTSTGYKNTDNTQGIILYSEYGDNSTATKVLEKEGVNFIYNMVATSGTPNTITSNSLDRTLKGDSQTIVIVLDSGKDTTVYTGVNSIPGITFAAHATTVGYDNARVSYVTGTGSEANYVKYAFVDVSDVTEKVDDSAESKDYVFVLRERTGKNYVTTSDYYYEYDLYRDGNVETNVKVDEDATLKRGVLYHKIKTNSKGYISGQNAITHDGTDYYVATAVNGATYPISYNNGTITLANNAKNGSVSFVLNTNNIVLLYNKDTDIRSDKGANYEVYEVNGSTLESNLDGYTYTYSYYAVLDDNNAGKINELYVFISDAADPTTVTPTTLSTDAVFIGDADEAIRGAGTNLDLYWYAEDADKTTLTNSDILAMLNSKYTNVSVSAGKYNVTYNGVEYSGATLSTTRVYKVTIDSTVYYTTSTADLAAVGSHTNVLLDKDGKYVTKTNTLQGTWYAKVVAVSDGTKIDYVDCSGVSPKFNTTLTRAGNSGALDKDVTVTTKYYKVTVSGVKAGTGLTDTAKITLAATDPIVIQNTEKTDSTNIFAQVDTTIYAELTITVSNSALTKDLAYTVPANAGSTAKGETACTVLIMGAGIGNHTENVSYTLAGTLTAKDITVAFTLADKTAA